MSKPEKISLSHVDSQGRAHMVNVGEKPLIERKAVATAQVQVSPDCAAQIDANSIKKGDVLTTAQLAGMLAAKQTPALIPLCHPLRLDHVHVNCRLKDQTVHITAEVAARERTGVEMEALTAVGIAALTVFDMCKAVDPAMTIGPIQVETKTKDGKTSFDRSTISGTR